MNGSQADNPKFQFKSKTVPSSPTRSSSSSSSFEFTFSSSSITDEATTVAADELFCKGQLLPLHPSQRMSMVRSLLLGSSTSSSASNSSLSASRDSSGSTSSSDAVLIRYFNCDSSCPSSVAELDEDDEFIEFAAGQRSATKCKSFSFGKFASVFRKERENETGPLFESGSVKQKTGVSSVREFLRKYVKKVKPLCENLSHKKKSDRSGVWERKREVGMLRNSFSGSVGWNGEVVASRSSCPASIRSSPYHSGAQSGGMGSMDSAMEELQSAIQGAIAHCKDSMLHNKNGP